jgi:hypothetical protein
LSARGYSGFLMGFLRILVSLGGEFHGLPGKLVPGLMFVLIVMRRSDAVSVRGEIMIFGGSLMPVVSAFSAVVSTIASVAHKSLLCRLQTNYTTPAFLPMCRPSPGPFAMRYRFR